jgi:hypothetical protein
MAISRTRYAHASFGPPEISSKARDVSDLPSIQPGPEPEATLSAVSSLKEVVTVVMGLTMTNTLVLLVTDNYTGTVDLRHLPARTTAFSVLLILTIFRFYHGNMRHLDCVYGRSSPAHNVRPAPRGGLGVDFFVLLAQSTLFAVMGFYASRPKELLILFAILLASDVIWTLLVQKPTDDAAEFSHQRRWLLNNIGALLVLLAVFAISEGGQHSALLIYGGGIVMLGNALLDFAISWKFYFPSATLS